MMPLYILVVFLRRHVVMVPGLSLRREAGPLGHELKAEDLHSGFILKLTDC